MNLLIVAISNCHVLIAASIIVFKLLLINLPVHLQRTLYKL